MNKNTPQQLRLQWLALLLAFGCQFTGLAVAYALSRSAAFADTLSRSTHLSFGDNGRLA